MPNLQCYNAKLVGQRLQVKCSRPFAQKGRGFAVTEGLFDGHTLPRGQTDPDLVRDLEVLTQSSPRFDFPQDQLG